MNVALTQENELAEEDVESFNDCQGIDAGDVSIYMRYICMKQSFNIKFFDDALCTEKLTIAGMRDLYTYEWDKCYKRADGEWMIVRKPKFET